MEYGIRVTFKENVALPSFIIAFWKLLEIVYTSALSSYHSSGRDKTCSIQHVPQFKERYVHTLFQQRLHTFV